jgi:hypothetical protein
MACRARRRRFGRTSRRCSWVLATQTPIADPYNGVDQWLVRHTFKFDHAYIGDVRLSGFYTGPAPGPAAARSEQFGEAIRLVSAAAPGGALAAGQVAPVALTWEAATPITQTVTAFLHLEDSLGNLVAQRDAAPLDGYRPATDWAAGQTITDHMAVRVPLDAPVGDYRLYVGLYDALTGERLHITPAQSGDRLLLADLRIVPAP